MKTLMRLFGFLVLAVVVVVGGFALFDVKGEVDSDRTTQAPAQPAGWIDAKESGEASGADGVGEGGDDKQILFGDLHVHSTVSMDAFLWSLPMMNGEGVHPPADACDYARYCSSLDFWSLTDHAESMTPRHWQMQQDMVRRCDAATDPADPDLVTFLGWEWTQVGQTPEDHYGHRNVVLLETDPDKVPTRPITSGGLPLKHMRRQVFNSVEVALGPYVTDFPNRKRMMDQFVKQDELRNQVDCPSGINTNDLPPDCIESAETPDELWTKFRQWGGEVLAIPHGTSWGFYTPPGVRWDKQLTSTNHDERYQRMIEVMSGHGNSEEYRDWRAVEYAEDGSMVCPEPSDDYLPCCHRAGELIRERCSAPDSEQCQAAVDKAEIDYLNASVAGHLVVPGAKPEDWLDCGQCKDCYLPALNYRPGNSVQYIMALSNFDEDENDPLRFRFGFIASSDNHASQPGTGYKEVGRHKSTEVFGAANERTRTTFLDAAKRQGTEAESIPFDRKNTHFNLFQYAEAERLSSYFYTGGLVAVHSEGRDRQAVWDAMQRREVYGTSGDRILLWFDLLGADGSATPMGSGIETSANPRFRVRAVGAFEQKPGCPEHSIAALGAERLDYMCGGECYNPGDTRKVIERIEVVRIRPQATKGEPIGDLIEDPWKVLECKGDPTGCEVEFSDDSFAGDGRDTLYYVRALERPSATINAGNERCERDESGRCVKAHICFGDSRTPLDDDCTAPAAERAWSSPIFVDWTPAPAAPPVAATDEADATEPETDPS